MDLRKHLTPEEFKELSDTLENAEKLISKAMGKRCDLVAVAHQRHGDEEKCSGVSVLTCIPPFDTFSMLARAAHEMEDNAKQDFMLRHVSANEMPA
jgi:hypothetical protein